MLDSLPRRLMQHPLFAPQGFHLPFQALHSGNHAVEGGDRFGRILAGEGSVGGGFEGREDVFVLPFHVLLSRFEIFTGDFMGEAEERLVLSVDYG